MVKRKKMDNNNINNSELFICFTSRLSSSSSTMKKQLSSKSILSPNRINSESNNNNNKQISLSSSLSRRLRNNGSLKGGQSPMFLTNGNKKRGGGSGFDNNQEPTSPKVTCIGQVRVKSKKKQLQQQQLGLKMRSISSRKTGEVSFRRIENCSSSSNCKQDQILITQDGLNHRNQKWVHLPLTICEALKGFGSDFNCFSSCSMKDKNGGNGNGDDNHHNHGCSSKFTSCGRWLVVGDGGDGGKGREIELIVRGETETENNEEEDEVLEHRKSSYRKRNVMEDIDIDEIERCNEERFGVLKNDDEKRVSICVPPKNALLLMRCRSDPVKMAALANKFWESNSTTTTTIVDDHDEKDEENDEQHHEEEKLLGECEIEKHDEKVEVYENVLAETDDGDLGLMEVSEIVDKSPLEAVIDEINHDPDHEIGEIHYPDQEIVEIHQESESEMMVSHQNSSETGQEENESSCAIEGETLLYQNVEDDDDDDEHVEQIHQTFSLHNLFNEDAENRLSTHSEAEQIHQTENEEKTEESPSTTSMEKTAETEQISSPTQQQETTTTTTTTTTNDESSSTTTLTAAAAAPKRLPDCLLLMMCEPKLSMEVSKETWVCSTDFIKCLPPPSSNSTATKTEQKKKPSKIKKRVSIDSNPGYIIQPARSSCSFPLNAPAPVLSMGKMIEMKFANSTAAAAAVGGYEPFVLTRCKSEPMRKSAKIAPPEGCFWKDKKFEPHHRGAAAGVGC